MSPDKKIKTALTSFFFVFAASVCAQEFSVSTAPISLAQEKTIKIGDIVITAEIKGTPSAYETYDIHSPFDGRIDEVMAELFDKVDKKTVLGRMVTKDMAAILDTANAADPESKKDIVKRWKGTFDYYSITPEEPGIVTNVYIKPRTYVNKGDRLFTVAKRMQIIATNTEPIYSDLSIGMKSSMFYVKDDAVTVDLTLKNFVPFKNKNRFYRLWLEVDELKERIKVGELFGGTLKIGESHDTKLLPKDEVLLYNGKRYVIMEVKTGLISENEVEILSPTMNYIRPELVETKEPPKKPLKKIREVKKDGKNKARE
ncbi:MAG: hypothetical protein COT17_07965 [Elusimicrobia bacterium CG08_land_8_20_14_0_20_51_18]|nr:MAG: hypothetical protein COT17_07965 [Elusimicrobia bacterium CG08_land_8_20_14_0_20_51_18]